MAFINWQGNLFSLKGHPVSIVALMRSDKERVGDRKVAIKFY